jgi:hypothetical protein
MTRATDAQPPNRRVSATYRCALCGAEAGHLQLKIYDAVDEATFVLRGLVGETTQWVPHKAMAPLVRTLPAGNAREPSYIRSCAGYRVGFVLLP